jgi:hypothetical protein
MLLAGITLSADEKNPAKKDEKGKSKDEKLINAVVMLARITHVENGKRSLAVDIPYPVRSGWRWITNYQHMEFNTSDDLKVRMTNPPADFDEKGRPRKYSSKELKEMKGPDPKLPGYTGDFDSLKAGQWVRLYVPRPKPLPVKPLVKGKKKDADEDDPMPEEKREVLMVVVVAEAVK